MTTNQTYKPSEGKREEFRKYLEKSGVLDALTKVLVCLYEEVDKPTDALEYLRDKLASQAGLETFKQLQIKLDEAQQRIKELEEENEKLKETAVLEETAGKVEGDEVPEAVSGGTEGTEIPRASKDTTETAAAAAPPPEEEPEPEGEEAN